MSNNPSQLQLDKIGQIRDLVSQTTSLTNPFLYYLPDILQRPEFSDINSSLALQFTQLAFTQEHMSLVSDALKILNQMVTQEDGTVLPPVRNFFYDNRNFFWDELGGYTNSSDVIMHILNKTMFVYSLGQKNNL